MKDATLAYDRGAFDQVAAQQTVEQSAIDYTHSVLEEARMLAGLVEELANRLLGAIPETAGKDGLAPHLDGKLPVLCGHAQSVRARISDALGALGRIDRAL